MNTGQLIGPKNKLLASIGAYIQQHEKTTHSADNILWGECEEAVASQEERKRRKRKTTKKYTRKERVTHLKKG